jgi:hypothetical protein
MEAGVVDFAGWAFATGANIERANATVTVHRNAIVAK